MKEWGYEEAEDMLREAESYRRDIIAAVDRLTDKTTDPWFVPWDLSAPKLDHTYFNGVCGPINLAYAGVLPRNDERIDHVIRWNIEKTHRGSPERSATSIMFYSQDLAITLLELGRRKKNFCGCFYTIIASNLSPDTLTTYEWLEQYATALAFRIQHDSDGPARCSCKSGTMRCIFCRACRAAGSSRGRKLEITRAPTNYGNLSLTTHSDITNNLITIKLDTPERIGETPIKLKMRLPGKFKITGVTLNRPRTCRVRRRMDYAEKFAEGG